MIPSLTFSSYYLQRKIAVRVTFINAQKNDSDQITTPHLP